MLSLEPLRRVDAGLWKRRPPDARLQAVSQCQHLAHRRSGLKQRMADDVLIPVINPVFTPLAATAAEGACIRVRRRL